MSAVVLDRLETADGVSLEARAWFAQGHPPATVVLAHGFSAHTSDPHVGAVAEMLQRRGLDVVSYDARGHGRSGGQSTLGDLEAHDVAAAVAVASLRSERVLVVGASMGAIAVLRHAAASDAAVDGVVLVSCPARWSPLPQPARCCRRASPARAWGARSPSRFWRDRVPALTNPEPPARSSPVRVPVASSTATTTASSRLGSHDWWPGARRGRASGSCRAWATPSTPRSAR